MVAKCNPWRQITSHSNKITHLTSFKVSWLSRGYNKNVEKYYIIVIKVIISLAHHSLPTQKYNDFVTIYGKEYLTMIIQA